MTNRVPRKKGQHRGSKSHSDLYTDENPKGTIKGLKFATVKDAKASVSKIKGSGKSHAHKIQAAVAMEQRAKEMGKSSQANVYRAYINKMKKKTKENKDYTFGPDWIPTSLAQRKKMKRIHGKLNRSIREDIKIPVKVGDTVTMGRFKNKKVKVKTIETDEFGMPIINGRPACTFRMVPNPR